MGIKEDTEQDIADDEEKRRELWDNKQEKDTEEQLLKEKGLRKEKVKKGY